MIMRAIITVLVILNGHARKLRKAAGSNGCLGDWSFAARDFGFGFVGAGQRV